jgi:hypothetical protein
VLEVAHRSFGVGTKDAVEPTSIETETAEAMLEIGDIVTSGHWRPEVDHAITEPIVGVDERSPRLAGADAVFHKPTSGLEGSERLLGVVVEVVRVAGLVESGRGETLMEVTDRRTTVAVAKG